MRTAKVIITFLGVFFAYHIFFGCTVFSTNEEGVLQTPVWYPFVGIVISAIPAYLVFKGKRKFTNKSFWRNADKDIAARIIIETEQASISMIQRKAGWSYERPARAIDETEQLGIVSPFDGRTPRKILVLE